ncbi:SigB/SigF/SigG family RNA polymerase sigma factor [Yinghuangia seranimata]|uniref:SigB/SigF/SigG family RNA polymerase sigma factor n=1 Tax=Yinghuangia seranimata TaxID=408067 RepID=UPI00248AC890|nr:SigB/SigF/SigG family RNA polymerase sigma factor [Yinghuangia seranimata]
MSATPLTPRSGTAEARARTGRLLVRLHGLDQGTAEHSRVRAEIVDANIALVRHLARRYRGRQLYPDVVQTGVVGLIKAVDAYDPGHGNEFVAFAVPTIAGEIKRFFRDTGWPLHVPRGQQEGFLAVTRTADDLQQHLGREATEQEIAERLDMSTADVRKARDADRAYNVESLDAAAMRPGGAPHAPLADRIGGDERALDLVDFRVSVTPLLATLSERDKTILRMRFWDDLTQRQIGERLGISQMHVSRLLAAVLRRLRTALDREPRAAAV